MFKEKYVCYILSEKNNTVEKLKKYVKDTLGRDIIEETVRYKKLCRDHDKVYAYLR